MEPMTREIETHSFSAARDKSLSVVAVGRRGIDRLLLTFGS
jgi:hypothetical protein